MRGWTLSTRVSCGLWMVIYRRFLAFLVDTFGPGAITPNMHLGLHYPFTVPNSGRVVDTWVFSFEQRNGKLLSSRTPGRKVAEVFMRNFDLSRAFEQYLSMGEKNQFESRLMDVAVRKSAATRLASDTTSTAAANKIKITRKSMVIDTPLRAEAARFCDVYAYYLQGYSFDPTFSNNHGAIVKTCSFQHQQIQPHRTFVIVNGSTFDPHLQDRIALVREVFVFHQRVLARFEVARWCPVPNSLPAGVIRRLDDVGIRCAQFMRDPRGGFLCCRLSAFKVGW